MELHRHLAFRPEVFGEARSAGIEPGALLERLRSQVSDSGGGQGSTRLPDPEALIERMNHFGIDLVSHSSARYPDRLRAIRDAPPVLFVRGEAHLAGACLAIVGARAATQASCDLARRMASDLAAAGITIVSGLARGIDAAAHRGALDVGGRTVAVLGCGPDRVYPSEHRRLADEVVEQGAIVSELPLGSPPRASHFPLRNRLISGLSLGVVVVEARRRSGSLITVRHALDQGREVFVVPGAVLGPFAQGTNQLLRDGARPVRSALDVMEDLGLPLRAESPERDVPGGAPDSAHSAHSAEMATGDRARVLGALGRLGALAPDELVRHLEGQPGELAGALVELELAGAIQRDRDGRIHLRSSRSGSVGSDPV